MINMRMNTTTTCTETTRNSNSNSNNNDNNSTTFMTVVVQRCPLLLLRVPSYKSSLNSNSRIRNTNMSILPSHSRKRIRVQTLLQQLLQQQQKIVTAGRSILHSASSVAAVSIIVTSYVVLILSTTIFVFNSFVTVGGVDGFTFQRIQQSLYNDNISWFYHHHQQQKKKKIQMYNFQQMSLQRQPHNVEDIINRVTCNNVKRRHLHVRSLFSTTNSNNNIEFDDDNDDNNNNKENNMNQTESAINVFDEYDDEDYDDDEDTNNNAAIYDSQDTYYAGYDDDYEDDEYDTAADNTDDSMFIRQELARLESLEEIVKELEQYDTIIIDENDNDIDEYDRFESSSRIENNVPLLWDEKSINELLGTISDDDDNDDNDVDVDDDDDDDDDVDVDVDVDVDDDDDDDDDNSDDNNDSTSSRFENDNTQEQLREDIDKDDATYLSTRIFKSATSAKTTTTTSTTTSTNNNNNNNNKNGFLLLESALRQGVVPASAGVGSYNLPGDFGFDPLNLVDQDLFYRTQQIIIKLLPERLRYYDDNNDNDSNTDTNSTTIIKNTKSKHNTNNYHDNSQTTNTTNVNKRNNNNTNNTTTTTGSSTSTSKSFSTSTRSGQTSVVSMSTVTLRPRAIVLRDYREAEIRHGRLAMIAAIFWPLQEMVDRFVFFDILDNTINTNTNYGTICGPLFLQSITLPYFPLVMTAIMLLLGYLDIYSQSIKDMDKLGDAFLPGDCFWDPLQILVGATEFNKRNMQERELFNSRAAMIAIASYIFQEFTTGIAIVDLPRNQLLFKPIYQIPYIQQWLDYQFTDTI